MQPLILVGANNNDPIENQLGDSLRMQPSAPHNLMRSNANIADNNKSLFLPKLPQGLKVVVKSSLIKMLTMRGLFSGLPWKDAHARISKLRDVCEGCMRRLDLD